MNKIQKIVIGSICALIVLAIIIPRITQRNLGGFLVRDTTIIGTSASVPYDLNVGSSTSLTLSTKNANKVSVNVKMTATSTASVLLWTYFYSQDGVNYFAEDANTATSNILKTHGATDVVHTWTPATTSAVSKRIELPAVNSNFVKITFTGSASTSKIYAEGISEQESN